MDRLTTIVELLREGGEVSGERMAGQLGISRTSVWKYINDLRNRGFKIESSSGGYRMVSEPDLLLPERVRGWIKTRTLGRHLEYEEECDSTSEVAKGLARRRGREGTVVVCEEQLSGRGRLEREWISPRGGLWFSVILKPTVSPAEATKLGLMASLSVAKTLRGLYRLDATLKWPNDILVKNKKVSGVLVEVEAEIDVLNFAVVGIGLDANVDIEGFPPEVREIATTLKHELGREVNRAELLASILEELENNYRTFMDRGFRSLKEEYGELCSTLDSEVRVVQRGREIRGRAIEIDRDGALVVLTPQGREKITYGDTFHLRMV